MTRIARAVVGLALGVAMVPAVTALALLGAGATTLLGDPRPDGPECLFELEGGSGAGGVGVERLDRFPPARRCASTGAADRGEEHRPLGVGLDPVQTGLVVLAGAGVGCVLGGAVALRIIHGPRSVRSSLVSGVPSPT